MTTYVIWYNDIWACEIQTTSKLEAMGIYCEGRYVRISDKLEAIPLAP